jgi:hypothetical protein
MDPSEREEDDISILPRSEFDELGSLELLLWMEDVNVTRRCMAQTLSVLQEAMMLKSFDDSIQARIKKFLDDIVKIVYVMMPIDIAGLMKMGTTRKMDHSNLVNEIDLLKFYGGDYEPNRLATAICEGLESSLESIGGSKGKDPAKTMDGTAIRRSCWQYYLMEKKSAVTKEEWLSPECTYRLFLIYNKLLLREDTTDLDVSQVNVFLMKMVSLSEYTWSSHLEYKPPEDSKVVDFPEFVTIVTSCFGKLYLRGDFICELILELYELMVLGILKKGFLVKKGHSRRNWNRRYFVLHLTTLSYYEEEDISKSKLGELMLNQNTKLINVRNADSPKHPRMFQITCGVSGREFLICAESERSKQSWILALQKALALVKIRNPSDREDFKMSLDQWSRSVYGESPLEFKEEPPKSETALLVRSLSLKLAKGLKSKSSTNLLDTPVQTLQRTKSDTNIRGHRPRSSELTHSIQRSKTPTLARSVPSHSNATWYLPTPTDDDPDLDLSISSTKSDCEDSMSISSPTSVTNHANALTQYLKLTSSMEGGDIRNPEVTTSDSWTVPEICVSMEEAISKASDTNKSEHPNSTSTNEGLAASSRSPSSKRSMNRISLKSTEDTFGFDKEAVNISTSTPEKRYFLEVDVCEFPTTTEYMCVDEADEPPKKVIMSPVVDSGGRRRILFQQTAIDFDESRDTKKTDASLLLKQRTIEEGKSAGATCSEKMCADS